MGKFFPSVTRNFNQRFKRFLMYQYWSTGYDEFTREMQQISNRQTGYKYPELGAVFATFL